MNRSLLLLGLCACFPYRELYRPDVQGQLVDAEGAAVAGVTVTTCSYTHWYRPKIDCPRTATTVTDRDGGFQFPALKEWDWCCLGEAPLPITELFVCSADAGAGFAADSRGWPKEPVVLRLGEGSPRCAEP